ncbi:hypothetical protein WJX74_009607 [Apatococcus lobatus]|uniref:DUF1826 domain-containing protein n=1 Tax=Apatococcus lobatus TaxID=904363 RepID=A0AAW1QYT3_9CHLO
MGQLTTPLNTPSLKHNPLYPKQVLKRWVQPQPSEISSRPLDIRKQHVRIVHQERQTSLTEKLSVAVQGLAPFTRKVTAERQKLQENLPAVAQDIPCCKATEALLEDVRQQATDYMNLLGLGAVEMSLSLVHSTSCPRLHEDSVKVRCLCTYLGEGTLFVEDRHVDRQQLQLWLGQDTGGFKLRKNALVHQANPGDVLYLKGSAYPGNAGRGAVHRSPDGASVENPRLVLRLDPASSHPCDCC